MMSSKKIKNEMQSATNSNLCQADWPDLPNNIKTEHSRKGKEEITTICNDFTNPPCSEPAVTQDANSETVTRLRCDAEEDGKCEGEIEVYNHFHFNCLAADVRGQPSTHNFCKYHYDNAKTCPVHPCFSRTYF